MAWIGMDQTQPIASWRFEPAVRRCADSCGSSGCAGGAACSGGKPAAMNIMILTYAETSSWYAATLMSRGHLVTMWGGGVVDPFVAEEFEDYDGCLLLGTEPELIEIADIFETKSKKVWRQLGDIPRERDRPQAEY